MDVLIEDIQDITFKTKNKTKNFIDLSNHDSHYNLLEEKKVC